MRSRLIDRELEEAQQKEEQLLQEAEKDREAAEVRLAKLGAIDEETLQDEIFKERIMFSKTEEDETDSPVDPKEWTHYLEQSQIYASRERNLNLELNILLSKCAGEKEKHEKLKYKIDGFRATETICARQQRALKAKRQSLQGKLKGLLQWFKVEASAVYEREKERSTTLLQLNLKYMDELKTKTANSKILLSQYDHKKDQLWGNAFQNRSKRDELLQIQANVMMGNQDLAAVLENLTTQLSAKMETREEILRKRKEREEQRRIFERKLFREACNKASLDTQIELEQLQVFEIASMNIEQVFWRRCLTSKLPDFRPAPNLRLINMDNNNFSTLDGLETLQELSYLTLNSNHVNKLNLDNYPHLRHLEVSNNSITSITAFISQPFNQLQGSSGLKLLRWLDISNNPIRSLDFLRDAISLTVLLMKSIRV